MYSEFAYSSRMQLILAVIAFLSDTVNMFLVANLLLKLYGNKVSAKQRFIFAFLSGAILKTAFVYLVFFIGGANSFTQLVFLLVASPNPFIALLYYYMGIKFLNLSPIRSVKLMGHIYLYCIIVTNINRLVTSLFFVQSPARYNYMLDATRLLACLIVMFVAYNIAKTSLNSSKFTIEISNNTFIKKRKELIIYFLKAVFIYSVTVSIPIIILNDIVANCIIILILSLSFAFNILLDIDASKSMEIENRDVHIDVLSKGINEFSSIKHDFYNILQTYDGYLNIGDLEKLKMYHSSLVNMTTHAGSSIELVQRMPENPAFISLLMSKAENAEKMNTNMRIKLKSSLENLYIDNVDVCRCVACLLDNAIESAAESEQRNVFFTVESKQRGSKLIIITNSTATPVDISEISAIGVTSKHGHQGIGLYNVRKTIEKYGNCTFQITYYNYEFSAYIELKDQ